jgi:probable rRNA maturation factor
VIFLDIQEIFQGNFPEPILTSAAEATLLESEVADSPSLLIKITDDQEVQSLNSQFRGMDKTTDVLSFPADFLDPDLDSRYLGDVVISYPRADEQALKRGHTVEAELQLLVVHGILHLVGFDHGDPEEKKIMWTLQSRILSRLGLDIQVEEN